MSKAIEIKVKGCAKCPFWQYIETSIEEYICSHPCNMYDGIKQSEFIEHCPLKQTDTIIKFERE